MLNLKLVGGVAIFRSASAAVTFLTSLILMRALSPADYGVYAFYFSVFTMAVLLPGVGVNNGFVSYSSADSSENAVLEMYIAKTGLVIAGVAVVGAAYWLGIIDSTAAACVAAGLLFSNGEFLLSVKQSKKKFTIFALLLPLRSLTMAAVIIVYVYVLRERSPTDIFFYFLGVGVLSLFCTAWPIITEATYPKVHWSVCKAVLLTGLPFIYFEAAAMIMLRAEVWILTYFAAHHVISTKDVGSYMAGYNFAFALPLLTSSIYSVLLAHTKKEGSFSTPEFRSAERRLIVAATLFGILYATTASVTAHFLFPNKYVYLNYTIVGVAAGMLLSFFASLERLKALNKGLDRQTNYVTTLQIVTSLGLNAIFIFLFGIRGAIVAFVMTRLVAYIGYRIILLRWRNNVKQFA